MQRDHTNEIDPNAPVTEQASAWWALLNEGDATPADHRAFGEWVARSPERVEAYLQAAQITQALRSSGTRWPDTPVEEIVRAARVAPSEVVSLPGAPLPRTPGTSNLPRIVLAFAAVLIVAVAIGLYVHLSPQRVETALGEQRSVVLADGSLVTLNTSSAIEVQMTKGHRLVKLLAGEALFVVAHDAARPFDVTTGNTTVRAVGTQFNVDHHASDTTVTVVEGRVAVFAEQDKLPLQAGEQLTLAPRSARQPVVKTDVATAIAWTQRKLIFEHRQLGEVADEFNRYNRQVIDIQSAELRNQEVTGVFQANDPDSFLTFLSRLPGVAIEKTGDRSRVVVRQRG